MHCFDTDFYNFCSKVFLDCKITSVFGPAKGFSKSQSNDDKRGKVVVFS